MFSDVHSTWAEPRTYVFMYIFRYLCIIVAIFICFDKLYWNSPISISRQSVQRFLSCYMRTDRLGEPNNGIFVTFHCEFFKKVDREKCVVLNYRDSIRRAEYWMLETFILSRTRTKNTLFFIFHNHNPGNTVTKYRKTEAPFTHIPILKYCCRKHQRCVPNSSRSKCVSLKMYLTDVRPLIWRWKREMGKNIL
jgi:hypothetical protein